MKNIFFILLFLILSFLSYGQQIYNNMPNEEDTLNLLEKNLQMKKSQYTTTQIVKWLSVFSLSGAGISATAAVTAKRIGSVDDENVYKNWAGISAGVIGGSLIIAVITTIIEKKQYEEIQSAQEDINQYLDMSDYLINF